MDPPAWILDTPCIPRGTSADDDRVKVGLPYLKGVSERLARTFQQHGCRVFHKPVNSLRNQLTHVEDKSDPLKMSCVVYQVDCDQCAENYIGETARPLGTRIHEHQTRASSAIFEHTQNAGHSINQQSAQILSTEPLHTKRRVKEAIEIKTRRPSLNRDPGLDLPPVYDTALKLLTPRQPATNPGPPQ